MYISSRTPEGELGRCPMCGAHICIEPSWPPGDAPCPSCGCLVWFPSSSFNCQLGDFSIASFDSRSLEIFSGPTVDGSTPNFALQCCQLLAAFLFVIASMILLAAGLVDSCWHARALSEMIGWPGLCLIVVSMVGLYYSGAFDDRQVTQITPGQALDVVRCRSNLERLRKLTLAGRDAKDAIRFGDSTIDEHPMRDRLLDG
jgi:hypothetical protein